MLENALHCDECRSVPSLIQKGTNGFIVPPDNPEQLAKVIWSLRNNVNLQDRIGDNARKRMFKDTHGKILPIWYKFVIKKSLIPN